MWMARDKGRESNRARDAKMGTPTWIETLRRRITCVEMTCREIVGRRTPAASPSYQLLLETPCTEHITLVLAAGAKCVPMARSYGEKSNPKEIGNKTVVVIRQLCPYEESYLQNYAEHVVCP